jgi:hypothetical protein
MSLAIHVKKILIEAIPVDIEFKRTIYENGEKRIVSEL